MTPEDHSNEDSNISCRDSTYLVCNSRDEALTPEQQDQLKQHLATCPYCRTASVQFSQLFEQLDELFARPPQLPNNS